MTPDQFHNVTSLNTEQRAAFMDKVVPKVEQTLNYLYSRWQDEHAYEDFAEYATFMEKALKTAEPSAKFIRGSKRPFGMVCRFDEFPYDCLIFITAREIGWKSVISCNFTT